MKFKISKNILIENLNYVSKAITNKTIIPILNGIRFNLTEEGLELIATDSELTIKSFINKKDIKEIVSNGICVIQSKYLLDIIRKMPEEDINFEIIDGLKIKIYTKKNQYSLNCLDSKDFPKFKIEESKNQVKVESKVLKEIIFQTSFAISTQESRPLLTGINFKINGNVFDITSTDSYRLAKKEIILKDPVLETVNIVIPGKNIIELEKILPEDGEVLINIFNSKAIFTFNNIVFQTNLISGSYPNTTNLIPVEFEIIVETLKKDFFEAIDRAALLTQNKEKNIVKMNIKNKVMKISSFSSEIGKVEEELNVSVDDKKEIDISFSAKYMLEALKTINSEKLIILLNSELKPIVIKSIEDETNIQLILPIKTY